MRRRQRADLGLGHAAQGKAEVIELGAGRRKQEIALIARRIDRAVQFGTPRPRHAADIVTGRQAIRPEIARQAEQISEFDPLVAAHAWDWGAPGDIIIGEAIDDAFAERRLPIDHIMRDAQAIGDRPRIGDVAPGAAAAGASHRGAVIIKLEGDADRLRPARRRQRRDHR